MCEKHDLTIMSKLMSLNIEFIWHDIVWQYSLCDLSFPDKDKLVAVSGLARRCGKGSNYLAGLWISDLLSQLLWRVRDDRPAQSYVRLSAAPSWSWASVHRRVSLDERFPPHPLSNENVEEADLAVVSVCSAQTSLVTSDPFGQVSSGCIKIFSCLITWDLSAVYLAISKWVDTFPYSEGWDYFIYIRDDFEYWSPDRKAYCLPLIKRRVHWRELMIPTVQGLWVEPTGLRHGEYKRRGSFILPLSSLSKLWPDDLQMYADQQLKPEEYEEYKDYEEFEGEEVEGNYHRYSITLV